MTTPPVSAGLVLAAVLGLVVAGGAAGRAPAREGPGATPAASPAPRAAMTVGGVPLRVELARNEVGDLGLSGRAGLEPGTGMLFVAEEPILQGFWMKGMRFCLDLVWIEQGRVVGATEGVCPPPPGTPEEALPLYFPPRPVRYVLEVPAGWLKAHALGPGAPVVLPAELATPAAAAPAP